MSEHIDGMEAKHCEIGVYTGPEYTEEHQESESQAEAASRWRTYVILIGEPSGCGAFAVSGTKDELLAWVTKLNKKVLAKVDRPPAAGRASTDENRVAARVQGAQEKGVLIDHEVARVIASWWYAGQASLGYSFVSTGAIEDADRLIADLCAGHVHVDLDNRVALRELEKYIRHYGPRPAIPFWSEIWV